MTTPAPETAPPPQREAFRLALRALASGVSIVASRDGDGLPCGIAMTAVMSLSFDPPSMLLAINRNASLAAPLLAHGRFSINILGDGDAEWCHQFVSTPPAERFRTADWADHPLGVPVYRGALASIVCDVDCADDFGSHIIVRGLVQDAILGEHRRGLIYLDGRYASAAA